jgi:hypothetical protein
MILPSTNAHWCHVGMFRDYLGGLVHILESHSKLLVFTHYSKWELFVSNVSNPSDKFER